MKSVNSGYGIKFIKKNYLLIGSEENYNFVLLTGCSRESGGQFAVSVTWECATPRQRKRKFNMKCTESWKKYL